MIGRVDGCYRDYKRDVWVVQIATHDMPKAIDSLKDCDLSIELKKYHAKRTLTANSYYWTLVGKLAKAIKTSNAACHNMLLRRYSTVLTTEMTVQVLDTPEAARKIDESTNYHLMPTSGINGDYRLYLMLKGSHDMDKAEFSRLLQGCIDECEEQGIETLTPDEVAKLRYEINNANRA